MKTDSCDHNLFWPPEQVVEFIKLVTDELKYAGLGTFTVQDGAVLDEAPGGSVTTFFAAPREP